MIDTKTQEELKIYLEKYYINSDTEIDDISEIDESEKYLKFNEDLTINEYVKKQLQNFNDILRNHIRNYNKKNNTKDSDIYKKANITKEHFNKIINQKIRPQKKMLIAKEEIDKLLNHAGFTFTNTSKFDIIIMFCLEKNIRDIITINEILYDNNEKCF